MSFIRQVNWLQVESYVMELEMLAQLCIVSCGARRCVKNVFYEVKSVLWGMGLESYTQQVAKAFLFE